MGVIESSREGGELNLHNLVIETQEKTELPFDIVRDITSDDWLRMGIEMLKFKTQIDQSSPDNGWHVNFGDFGSYILAIKMLDPHHHSLDNYFNLVDTYFNNETSWKKLHEMLNNAKKSNDDFEPDAYDSSAFILAMAMKLISPERFSDVDPDSKLWKNLLMLLNKYRQNENLDLFTSRAIDTMILFPDRKKEARLDNLDDSVWQYVLGKIEKERTNGNWRNFAGEIMKAKILFPEMAKSFDFNITKDIWQSMHAELDECRDAKKQEEFVQWARQMQVLAAKEINVTDRGIEFVMPQKETYKEKTVPMPERRRF